MKWLLIIPISLATIGLIYTQQVEDFLEDRGWLKLGLERSELERIAIIRTFLLLIIILSLIIFTETTQLIVGAFGMILGILIMYYSTPIYRLFPIAARDTRFRGDNKIKLIGLLICIVSAGWMSGISQALLYAILSTANLIPQNDLIDYY